jgi:D-aminoacyl-tRNA deacylase
VKAVIQRVTQAAVEVDGNVVGSIGRGILALVGVEKGDRTEDADRLADKIVNLRVFEDAAGKMNLSLREVNGEILAVSQFTLAGNCSKGRRPSFDTAAPPEEAACLYQQFVLRLQHLQVPVATGIFQAEMRVSLINDGPVTFILDSR